MPASPSRGRLLVAAPSLEDPNFFRSVVFLLAADADGALGVVLNRPSETPVAEIVPSWSLLIASPQVLFTGGPVQPNAAICVGRQRRGSTGPGPHGASGGAADADGGGVSETGEIDGYSPLVGELGTVDLHRDPTDIGVELEGLRVFVGYSGWGPGQLEDEIEAGAWFLLEGRHQDVLSDEPGSLWERVLRRQGGWLSVLSRHPVDASLN
ncbi:MAG: YqgE/AlgH family protein [Acidimicrobiales bacterium]